MGARPWMKLWVGDYLKDTAMLSTEEHGAYFLLLLQLWNDGGVIAQRDAQRVARVDERRWPDIWSRISRFFEVEGETLTQKRILIELTAWDQEQNARKRGAAITNQKRWGTSLNDTLSESLSESPTMSSTSRKSEVRSQKSEDRTEERQKTGRGTQPESGAGVNPSVTSTSSSGQQLLVVGPHGYEAPAWDPEKCWRHLQGIWGNAGRWIDGNENFSAAYKEFLKKVNAENWPAVCAGADWAVEASLADNDRKHLGVLVTFLREEKWIAQVPPLKAAPTAVADPDDVPWT